MACLFPLVQLEWLKIAHPQVRASFVLIDSNLSTATMPAHILSAHLVLLSAGFVEGVVSARPSVHTHEQARTNA